MLLDVVIYFHRKKSSVKEVAELGDRIHKSEDIPTGLEIPCTEELI